MLRSMLCALLWVFLTAAHLRTSRKKGSHPEKTHGTRAGFGIDGPKARRGRLAVKGRKIAESRKPKKDTKTVRGNGTSSKPVAYTENLSRDPDSPKQIPVYDNPKPVKGEVAFVMGDDKDGKPTNRFYSARSGEGEPPVLGYKSDVAEGAGMSPDYDFASGSYSPDIGLILGNKQGGLQLNGDEKQRMLDSFPDAKSIFLPKDGFYDIKQGNIVPRFSPDVGEEHARRVLPVMDKITGGKSNWSGKLVPDAEVPEKHRQTAAGLKMWTCDIWIDPKVKQGPSGPKVIVHELFHSYSPDKNPGDYGLWKGYEEAPVEMMARLHEEPIIRAMYPDADEDDILRMLGQLKTYSDYIEPMEQLRDIVGEKPKEFYGDLLKVPLPERQDYLRKKVLDAAPEEDEAMKNFRAADAKLRGLFAGF